MARYTYGESNDWNRMTDQALLRRYGTSDINRLNSMAMVDDLYAKNTADALALRASSAQQQYKDEAEVELARKKNRLGLSPLVNQLVDDRSAAYQDVDAVTGEPIAPIAPSIQVAPADGSVDPEFKEFRSVFGLSPLTRRAVKPGLQDAYDNLGTPTGSRITLDEYKQRANIDQGNKLQYITEKARLDGVESLTDAELQVLGAQFRARASDAAEDKNKLSQEYASQANSLIAKRRAELPAPAQLNLNDDGTTTTAQPAVEVSNDQVVKTTAAGTYYRTPDGKLMFKKKDGTVTDVSHLAAK